jgi:hypothetical protein
MTETKATHKVYAKFIYPENHFALSNGSKGEEFVIARYRYRCCVTLREAHYLVKVNPSDRREYRSLVVLITSDQKDMETTLNRPYSLLEKQGLFYLLSLVGHAYNELDLEAQIEVAGNNAHDFKDGFFTLGKKNEPLMLHGHVIGRGDPSHEYITGIKLGGPSPGSLFNMRGDSFSPSDIGNCSKEKWLPGEIRTFAAILERELNKITDYLHDDTLSKL